VVLLWKKFEFKSFYVNDL